MIEIMVAIASLLLGSQVFGLSLLPNDAGADDHDPADHSHDYLEFKDEPVLGNDQDDVINDTDEANHLKGNGGNDEIQGNRGSDWIEGGEGDDTIFADEGRDLVEGDDGDDLIDGGAWHDFLGGGSGDDTIEGGTGRDALFGNDGNDQLSGGDWHDTLTGGGGSDILHGGKGHDVLYGGGVDIPGDTVGYDQTATLARTLHIALEANFEALSTATDEEIDAFAADFLARNGHLLTTDETDPDGVDYLFGDAGSDTLYLDSGDEGTGGADQDTFVLNANPTGNAPAIVHDYTAEDLIELEYDGTGDAPDVAIAMNGAGDQYLLVGDEVLARFVAPATAVTLASVQLVPIT